MTPPVEKNATLITPYVGIKAGSTQAAGLKYSLPIGNTGENFRGEEKISLNHIGINGGVKVEKGNFYTDANATLGTAVGADVTVGYNQPIYKGLGLDLSVNAEGMMSLTRNRMEVEINYHEENTSTSAKYDRSYRGNYGKVSINPEVTYSGSWGKVGAGVEGGYRSTAKGNTNEFEFKGDKWYVTPTINAEVNVGKNIAITGEGNKYGGTLGVKYNF